MVDSDVTIPLTVIIVSCLINSTVGQWFDSDQLELFDLVEEVNGTNFYEFLQVNQTSTVSEIKKQFRILSLKYHPDKNKDQDSKLVEAKFRQLVSIAEVLKDDKKKKLYDDILINGLPNWKSGLYYIRRARKLGLLEMSIIVSIILTLGHYLCLIASFYEKSFEVDEVIKKRCKKLNQEEIDLLRSETMVNFGAKKPVLLHDNLVTVTIRFLIGMIIALPSLITAMVSCIKNFIDEKRKPAVVDDDEEVVAVKKPKTVRRPQELPDYTGLIDEDDGTESVDDNKYVDDGNNQIKTSKEEWSADEIANLIKLTKKFPTGTVERWEKVAMALSRSSDDVIRMVKKVKSGSINSTVITTNQSNTGALNDGKAIVDNVELSVRDDDHDSAAESANKWTQDEQKMLEEALLKYPKGTDERWDKIAAVFDNKSKEDCMVRFKYLADVVKKKKLAAAKKS